MQITNCRTFLEINVDSRQSVDLTLHVRRADIDWFNQGSVFPELLTLIQTSILPRNFSEEIEANYYRHHHVRHPPKDLGPGGIPLDSTSVNVQSKSLAGAKRQRGPTKASLKAEMKRKQEQRLLMGDDSCGTRSERDVLYAMNDSVKVAYRLEASSSSSSHGSATLLFANRSSRGKTNDTHFIPLQKLSKGIVLWCYPRQDNDEDDVIPTDEGFLRPEIIPIASLFPPSAASSSQRAQTVISLIDDDK